MYGKKIYLKILMFISLFLFFIGVVNASDLSCKDIANNLEYKLLNKDINNKVFKLGDMVLEKYGYNKDKINIFLGLIDKKVSKLKLTEKKLKTLSLFKKYITCKVNLNFNVDGILLKLFDFNNGGSGIKLLTGIKSGTGNINNFDKKTFYHYKTISGIYNIGIMKKILNGSLLDGNKYEQPENFCKKLGYEHSTSYKKSKIISSRVFFNKNGYLEKVTDDLKNKHMVFTSILCGKVNSKGILENKKEKEEKCTNKYLPVCTEKIYKCNTISCPKKYIVYSNPCIAKLNGAKILYTGKCRHFKIGKIYNNIGVIKINYNYPEEVIFNYHTYNKKYNYSFTSKRGLISLGNNYKYKINPGTKYYFIFIDKKTKKILYKGTFLTKENSISIYDKGQCKGLNGEKSINCFNKYNNKYYNAWCKDGKIVSNGGKAILQSFNGCGYGKKIYKNGEGDNGYLCISRTTNYNSSVCSNTKNKIVENCSLANVGFKNKKGEVCKSYSITNNSNCIKKGKDGVKWVGEISFTKEIRNRYICEYGYVIHYLDKMKYYNGQWIFDGMLNKSRKYVGSIKKYKFFYGN